MYSAYQLTPECRQKLVERVHPAYERVYADHITVQFGGEPPLPAPTENIKAIGVADDGQGIQAVLVEVNGNMNRPDHSFYHVTLSLNPDKVFGVEKYKPALSNILFQKMLEKDGTIKSDSPTGWTFTRFHRPILLQATPVLRYTSQELCKKTGKTR